LLQATRQSLASNGGVKEYLALSVTVAPDGAMAVRKLRLDMATRRAIPELLDDIPAVRVGVLSPAQTLLFWAQELALEELERD